MYPNQGGKGKAQMLQPKVNVRGGQIAGAKMAITKGQLTGRDQIDQLVERFTQTYNYKSYADMDRQYNCHQIEDSIKESHSRLMDEVRRQHREYKEKTLAQREQMLAELRQFRSVISKLIRKEVPQLVQIYRAKTGAAAEPPSRPSNVSGETVFSSLQSLKSPFDPKGSAPKK